MENISNFLEAAKTYFNLKSTDLFQTIDLFEAKDMQRVHGTILSLARASSGFTVRQQLPQTRYEDVIIEPPLIINTIASPPASLRNMRRTSNSHLGNMSSSGIGGIGNYKGSSNPNLNSSSVTPPSTTGSAQMRDTAHNVAHQSHKGSKNTTPTGSANGSSNGRGSHVAPINERLNEILTIVDGELQVQYVSTLLSMEL